MSALSDQVNYGPVIFSLLKMLHSEMDKFGSAQSATKQDCQYCTVALPSDLLAIWSVYERRGLFCGEPISESYADLFCSSYPTNTSCQLWTEQSSISGFICKTANRVEAQVNRERSQMAAF